MSTAAAQLDGVFQALADPTRRAVLERLSRGPASVGELAAPFDMALPSFMQHLDVLEDCGLVSSKKVGRVRTCRASPETLAVAQDWMAERRAQWKSRLDQLDRFLEETNKEKKR